MDSELKKEDQTSRITMMSRFLRKVKITRPLKIGCWLWTGYNRQDGYGAFSVGKGMPVAHRVSYELFIGPIPKGLHILHKCDNPSCVRPDHLSIGTHLDNMADKTRKGRQARLKGMRNGRAKLTENQIYEIRDRYILGDVTVSQLAREYGVSRTTVRRIVTYQLWRHI